MKVIKVGLNAQSRIAQACDRYDARMMMARRCVTTKHILTGADVEARRYAAMASDHAAPSAPTWASSARPVTS